MTIQALDPSHPRPRLAAALLLGGAVALAAAPLAAQDTSVTPDEQAMVPEENRPLSFADLATEVSPAVVNITTTTMVARATGPEGVVPEGSPFEDFFEDFQEQGPRRSSALGSGFVISEDGYVVTNNHVIEGADEITIEFFGGDTLPAEVVGTDPNTDIALLKVDGEALPFVEFGDADGADAQVGDWVMAMGNPLGQGFSISAGIISARNRALSGTYDDYIQTDAAINRGNSGGPLFSMAGEVIGVNTAILSPTGGSIGIGFAMSSAVVENVVDQLREFGETRRGWLGVRIQDVTPEIAEGLAGLGEPRGALVTDVPEGPARDAGLEQGDVILSLNGADVPDTRELVRMVGLAPINEAVTLSVLRDGDTIELDVTLGRREEAEAQAFPASAEAPGEAGSGEALGLTISEPTPELRERFGIEGDVEGLIVSEVDPASDAAAKGIEPGDLITEAGQRPIVTTGELDAAIAEAREAGRRSLLLLMRRGGDPRFVALDLGEQE